MKKIFLTLCFLIMLVNTIQAATFYSSRLGYWCYARNGKSHCFRDFTAKNELDTFIVDRNINMKGNIRIKGKLIIEENGTLNITGDGSLELEGTLEIHFAGILNVEKNLVFSDSAQVMVDRYGAINVAGDFINNSSTGTVNIDGKLEVLGSFQNQGIIAGLGKVITPGSCVEYPEALTFGQPGCAGINIFTLPVSLLTFEAKPQNNSLHLFWTTGKEEDFDYFQLQRAGDNFIFEDLEILQGKGDNAILNRYSYIDKAPNIGKNMYRLKSVDKNGSFEYHGALVIEYHPEAQKELKIYPNPLTGSQLKINLNFQPGENACLSIINSQGKTIARQEVSSYQEVIQLTTLPEPGLYIVLLENSDIKLQQRLLVK